MKILADEHITADTVEWLRSAGHEVLWTAESLAGCGDNELLNIAVEQDRVMLTRDRDFGELVFRRQGQRPAVVLLRLHALHPRHRLRVLQRAWPEIEQRVRGHFIVVAPGRLRVRPLDQTV